MSVLDTKNTRVMSFPLTVSQQVWLSFLLPALVEAFIYMIDLATDVAIGASLLKEGHIVGGVLTLVFLYIPPVVCFVMAMFSPPQERTCKNITVWLLTEILALIFFPLRPIQCFGERIFWGIEAARLKDPHKEEALEQYENSRGLHTETYLFLQAYLHAGPQLILQLVLVIWDTSTVEHTKLMQGVCMLTSAFTLALVTAAYQRYETQCKGGRRRVWDVQKKKRQPLLTDAPDDPYAVKVPRRVVWTKVMDQDDPLSKMVAFCFWCLLLFGRCLCLVMAASFIPWAVLAVCVIHYFFSLLYILPSPNCKSSIPIKILLAVLYIFCLVEVGIQFRKSYLLYTLFFIFTFTENLVLTLVWALWCTWEGWWYHYVISVLLMTHILGLMLALLYARFLRPHTSRIKPDSPKRPSSINQRTNEESP